MKGFAIVMMVVMADIVVNMTPIPNTVPETQPVVVETQAPTEAPTEAPKTEIPAPPAQEGFVAYRIHGITPPIEWQQYLYEQLNSLGFGWYMPYAVCQIFQESRWNQYSDNGVDVGLTQQKAVYWQTRAAHWGVPGASIWDPCAQLHVYAGMMCQFLAQTGSVEWALSLYFWGNGDYAPKYIADVMSHWGALEEVR